MLHSPGIKLTSAFALAVVAADMQAPSGVDSREFVQWVLQQGGLVTAIAMLLYFWRRDMLRIQAREQEIAARTARESDLFISIVRENSTAMTKSADAIDRLSGIVDRLERTR